MDTIYSTHNQHQDHSKPLLRKESGLRAVTDREGRHWLASPNPSPLWKKFIDLYCPVTLRHELTVRESSLSAARG